MYALSIRQPWAWLIVHGWKDIENRTWRTRVRGRLLIHAAKGMTNREYLDAIEFAHAACGVPIPSLPTHEQLHRGAIIGSANLVDCVNHSDSPWFCGPMGFVLRDPAPLVRPVPFRGSLGMFDVPDEALFEQER